MVNKVEVIESKVAVVEVTRQHTHNNKSLLDGYTHTDTEISDVISQTQTNTEDIAEISLGDSQKVKVSANDTTEGYLEEKLITEGDISSDVVDEGVRVAIANIVLVEKHVLDHVVLPVVDRPGASGKISEKLELVAENGLILVVGIEVAVHLVHRHDHVPGD